MKLYTYRKSLILIVLAFGLSTSALHAESRSERKAREAAESAKAAPVSGGPTFLLEMPTADAFPALIRMLQKADYSIETSNKDTGSIVTGLVVTGSYRQTGTRAQITAIDEGNGKTTVKVAVTVQKRFKALQTEPWSDPKIDPEQSAKLADALQAGLKK